MGLQYAWAAFKTVSSVNTQDFTIESTSNEFQRFNLDPYRLEVNADYLFTLTVYDPSTRLSGQASVGVRIQQADVVAVIIGGATAAVLFESSITIDASSSYDKDKKGQKCNTSMHVWIHSDCFLNLYMHVYIYVQKFVQQCECLSILLVCL